MKKLFLLLTTALLLINNNTFSMSPHKVKDYGPATIMHLLKTLQQAGDIDVEKSKITFHLAAILSTSLSRASLGQSASEDDSNTKREQGIKDIFADNHKKEQLLADAANREREFKALLALELK